MKRAPLIAAILVALLVAWLAREDESSRATHNSDTPRSSPGALAAREYGVSDSEPNRKPERPGAADAVLLTGKVTGPEGPLWGARVRVHASGQTTAFDQTTTKVGGTYRLETAIALAGETIDISAHPPGDAAMHGERLEGIAVKPGDSVARDFTLSAAPVIEGELAERAGVARRVRIGLVPLDRWQTLLAESGGVYPVGENLRPIAVKRTESKFRFAQVPPGRYVVTCDQGDGVILDPPIVEPGDRDIRVRITPVDLIRLVVRDAATRVPVDRATVSLDGFKPGAAFTRASGNGTGFTARLRFEGPEPRGPRVVRVSAPRYHDFVRTDMPSEGVVSPSDVALVAKDAAVLRIHLRGGGAAAFAKGIRVGSSSYVQPEGASVARLYHLTLPVLAANAQQVRVAIPAGDWKLTFHGTSGVLRGLAALPTVIYDSPNNEVSIELPEPAWIAIDWTRLRLSSWTEVWLTGGQVEWVEGEDEVMRPQQSGTQKTRIAVYRPNPRRGAPPSEFSVYPGAWTLTYRDVTGAKDSIPVNLAPGARVNIALGH